MMNIDTSGIGSYYRISHLSEHPQSAQQTETEKEKVNTSKVNTENKFQSSKPEKTDTFRDSSTDKVELSSSMSKYLSSEEKEMLNALFPPSGRNFGIRAYKKGQEPVGSKAVLGQKVDIKM
jgi:hypothetical protein